MSRLQAEQARARGWSDEHTAASLGLPLDKIREWWAEQDALNDHDDVIGSGGGQVPKGHGTHAAYNRHRQHGEKPCDACSKAHRAYMKAYRANRDDSARTPTSVYLYYDKYNVLLYVGITSRGIARNREHNTSKEWFRFVARQEIEHHKSRGAALNRENELIRKYRPPFNRQGNPNHAAAREAYYIFRETPRALRHQFLSPHMPIDGQPKRPPGPLPKVLWFRSSTLSGQRATFELASEISGNWRFVNVRRIRIKDHRYRVVGALVAAKRGIDGRAVIYADLLPNMPRPDGLAVSVRWPSSGRECEITSLRSSQDGGLR